MSAREELVEPKITPAPSRPNELITLPKRVDVGSQVIGSSHIFRACQLENPGLLPLFVAIEEHRPSPFGVASPFSHSATLAPQSAKPLDIVFSPTLATIGEQRSVLRVHATGTTPTGSDVTDVHEIELVGRGKHPNELPAESEQPKLPAPSARKSLNLPNDALADVQTYTGRALIALTKIRELRHNAVHNVEAQVDHFKPKEPKSPFWIAMAEIALNLASVGIASFVSRHVAAAVATKLDAAVRAEVEKTLVDILKDGIKMGGKELTSQVLSSGKTFMQATTGPEQFFGLQNDALADIGDDIAVAISNSDSVLRRYERDNPAVADVMRVFAEHLEAQKDTASGLQYKATYTQWMSALAKSGAGDAKTEQAAAEPTSMGKARQQELPKRVEAYTKPGGLHVAPQNGVLRIDVRLLDKLGEQAPRFEVKGASMHGVAHGIGQDLAKSNLARMPIPILLVLDEDFALLRISRNEAGVVELSSGFRGEVGPEGLQLHRAAKVLVDQVVSIPLAERGIAVKTDDV